MTVGFENQVAFQRPPGFFRARSTCQLAVERSRDTVATVMPPPPTQSCSSAWRKQAERPLPRTFSARSASPRGRRTQSYLVDGPMSIERFEGRLGFEFRTVCNWMHYIESSSSKHACHPDPFLGSTMQFRGLYPSGAGGLLRDSSRRSQGRRGTAGPMRRSRSVSCQTCCDRR